METNAEKDMQKTQSLDDAIKNDGEDKTIKVVLKRELSSLQFTEVMKQRVVERAKPSFWERELCIPVPLFATVCLLVVLIVFPFFWYPNKSEYAGPHSGQGDAEHNSRVVATQFVVINGGVFNENELRKGWSH